MDNPSTNQSELVRTPLEACAPQQEWEITVEEARVILGLKHKQYVRKIAHLIHGRKVKSSNSQARWVFPKDKVEEFAQKLEQQRTMEDRGKFAELAMDEANASELTPAEVDPSPPPPTPSSHSSEVVGILKDRITELKGEVKELQPYKEQALIFKAKFEASEMIAEKLERYAFRQLSDGGVIPDSVRQPPSQPSTIETHEKNHHSNPSGGAEGGITGRSERDGSEDPAEPPLPETQETAPVDAPPQPATSESMGENPQDRGGESPAPRYEISREQELPQEVSEAHTPGGTSVA